MTRARLLWIGGPLAAVLLLVAAEALDLGLAYRDLQHGSDLLRRAAATLGTNPEGWTSDRIDAAQADQTRARPLLEDARARLHRDPGLRLALRLPGLDDQARAALDLADAVSAGSLALADATDVARAYQHERGQEGPPGPRLLRLLAESRAPLEDADTRLQPELAALKRDLGQPLITPLRRRVAEGLDVLGPVQAQAHSGAQAAAVAPVVMGGDRPRSYLLLFANPAELRPAGGFVGSVGTITLDQATATQLEIHSHDYYNPLYQQAFPVPYPLGGYLSFYKNQLELGDAGWDPDFPATAQLSETMYASATGRQVDGTISVDPYMISAMLAVTGPVDVPGYGTFTADDFFARVDFTVNVSTAPGSGKEALGKIARAIVDRVQAEPVSAWPRLFAVFQEQAGERHLQVYMHDPALQQKAAGARYDGALLPGSDYQMVVDGNVGATKGDYYLQRSMEVRVEVYPDGVTRHQLTLRYQLPEPVDATDRALNPGDGSYRDYVRIYLPSGASVASLTVTLDGAPGGGGLDRITTEHGRQVVGAYFRLPRGHAAELNLYYEVALPPARHYELYIQKQAGTPGMPASVEVSRPGGIARARLRLTHDEALSWQW